MKIKRTYLFLIILITIFSFLIRLFRITESPGYYFDEVYHVVTAKAYADNNPEAYNPFAQAPKKGTAYDWLHPPLAKLIQAGSIKIFGDNPIGWRLPSVFFGTAIIPATFSLAYILFGRQAAIFSALVIAFENMTFVMSRITMNDVFVTFFIIISFIFVALYVRSPLRHSGELFEFSQSKLRDSRREVLQAKSDSGQALRLRSGQLKGSELNRTARMTSRIHYLIMTAIFLGLAVASKWTGLYAIGAIFGYLLWRQVRIYLRGVPQAQHHPGRGSVILSEVSKMLFLILIPILIYLASYGQFWLQGHTIKQFIDLHKQIWWYQNRSDLKHAYGSNALFCVPEGLTGPKSWCPWVLDMRPVYFSYEQYGEKAGYIYALGNPLVFWIGLFSVSYLLGKFIENRKKEYALILLGYFIFWVPWIFSPRILFMHHYLPSIPFLSISLGFTLSAINKISRFSAILIIIMIIAAFFFFYPITSGYPIDPEAIGKFMWLKTWR